MRPNRRNKSGSGKWILAFAAAIVAGGLAIHFTSAAWVAPLAKAENAGTNGGAAAAIPGTPATAPAETYETPETSETSENSAPAQPEPSETESASPSAEVPASKPPQPAHQDDGSVPAWAKANLPSLTIRVNEDDLAVVTNASSLYVLVNKKRNLPSDYVPKDLVVPDVPFSFSGDSPKKKMRKAAADALEKLFAGAKQAGIRLKAVSGYRAYATQKAIFDNNARKKGEEVANRTSAHPGQSEHQTGLAMDVSSASAGYALEESFGETKEGKWLAAHTAEYGFIIRYPEGKEKITGYTYEPWHIRYIGKEAAKQVAESHLTLEQFFDTVEPSATKR